MYLTIFQAIEKCQLLHFYYDGYFRVVEPHIYGVGKSGRDMLCGYQVAGADEIGKHNGWKSYYVDQIVNIEPLSAHFIGPRPAFHPSHRRWARIYAQLKHPCHFTPKPKAIAESTHG